MECKVIKGIQNSNKKTSIDLTRMECKVYNIIPSAKAACMYRFNQNGM